MGHGSQIAGRTGRAVPADRAAGHRRGWRHDRRSGSCWTTAESRPSISTFATAWLSLSGTRPANSRQSSRAEKRLQSISGPPTSKIAHVLQGHEQKEAPLRKLIEQLGLSPRQVCYVGDDLPDLPALSAVGLAACPADAAAEVKDVAHLITRGSWRKRHNPRNR